MKLLTGFVFVLVGASMFAGCAVPAREFNGNPRQQNASPKSSAKVPNTPDVLPGMADESRLKVYTGSVSLTAGNRSYAIKQIRELTKKQGGYFEHLSEVSITIRIPAAKFNATLEELAKIGEVTNRDIRVVDVTDQFRDIEAELANLQAVRDRLKTLLAKSTDVKNTLEIEKELTRVQTKIDQLSGTLKRLRKQVTFAKLTINLILPETSSSGLKLRNFTAASWLNSLGLDNLFNN